MVEPKNIQKDDRKRKKTFQNNGWSLCIGVIINYERRFVTRKWKRISLI